jgi:FkbM family methyltransferase
MKKLHWSLLKRIYRLRSRFGVYDRLGRRWLLDNRNWIDQQLIIRRPYEVAQLARCRELIRTHGLEAFYDIGANFGLYSVLLSDEVSLRQMHAFEPLLRNVHQFGANLYLNGLDSRITLHACALSDHSGKVELFVDPESTGVSTLLTATERSRQDAYTISVQIVACIFDELFPLARTRALLKIDVEGAEIMVLSGMRHFLAANAVALQIETTNVTAAPVDAFMRAIGYRTLGRIGSDAYYTNMPAP